MISVRSKVISIVTVIVAAFSIYPVWGRQPIVPDGVKGSPDFTFACEFLEAYVNMLNNPASGASSDTIRMAKEQGFCYLKGNDKDLCSLCGEEEFSISFDNGVYRTEWSRDGRQIVACSFPSRIDLLTFSNKIQLEDRMVRVLSGESTGRRSVEIPVMPVERLKKVEYSPFYVRDLGYYITPRLSHQVVYQLSEGSKDKCEIVNDYTLYPLECVSNYMLTGYTPAPINLTLDISRYGYTSEPVLIGLEDLFMKLSAEGSIPYWGVDEFDSKVVKGLYLWLNKHGGFAHVLTVEIPVSDLSSSSMAKARMNCYVRLDNLKNLFEEFK